MIKMLSDIGRALVIVGALLTVIGSAIAGYIFARGYEYRTYGSFTISGGGQITPVELLFAFLGLGIGVVVAGGVYGVIATIYDIRDNLRQIAGASSKGQPPSARERREPRA